MAIKKDKEEKVSKGAKKSGESKEKAVETSGESVSKVKNSGKPNISVAEVYSASADSTIGKAKEKKKTKLSKDFLKVSKESAKNYGTGKRKTSIARVWLVSGSGNVEVNKKQGLVYLASDRLVKIVQEPLSFLSISEKYDIVARVRGGGISGQASAIKAGVAKALTVIDESFHKELKNAGFLTRDTRIKERKHYGHKRARKSFQFSKR